MGYALEEIDNDITKLTPASFEPTIDYVVVKWPRFAFEKFAGADEGLTTHMKSVGEAMAIGRTFKQAFAKAMRSRELDAPIDTTEDDLLTRLEIPSWDRYDVLQEAFRRGATPAEVHERTSIDPWFLRELQSLALDPEEPFRGAARVPLGRHVRRGVRRPARRTSTRAGSAAAPRATRCGAATGRR